MQRVDNLRRSNFQREEEEDEKRRMKILNLSPNQNLKPKTPGSDLQYI